MTHPSPERGSLAVPESAGSSPERLGWFGLLLVVLAYFTASKLGLMFATISGNSSPVWPPTGLAIALAWRFGNRVGPGILIGSTLANFTTAIGFLPALLMGLGNTAEALLACRLLRRPGRFSGSFTSKRDLLHFMVWAGLVATAVSATTGTLAMFAADSLRPQLLPKAWLTWWLGDAMGAMIVTPPVLALFGRPAGAWSMARKREGIGLILATLLVGYLAFAGEPLLWLGVPAMFLALPLLVWSSMRFGWQGVGVTVCLLATIAIWCTGNELGAFGQLPAMQTAVVLQTYLLTLSGTGQFLAILSAQRQRQRLDSERWRRLHEHTEAMTRLGSWEWSQASGEFRWSKEVFRLHNDETGAEPRQLEEFLSRRVLAEDHPVFLHKWQQALASGQAEAWEYRVPVTGAGHRIIRCEGCAVRNAEGQVTGLAGTSQDVTERRQAEQRLRQSEERLRLALDSTEDGVWDWNLATGELFTSPRMATMLGYQAAEIAPIVSAWEALIHPEDLARSKALFEAHLAGERPGYDCELRARHRQGHWVWLRSRAKAAAWDATGRPTRMIGTHLNIAAQKEAAAALERNMALLRETSRLAHLGGWELDLATMQLCWSEEVYRIHDVDPDFRPTWEAMTNYYAPAARAALLAAFEKAITLGHGWDLELPFNPGGGRSLWVRVLGQAEFRQGRVARLSGTLQDITKLKRAETLLSREKDQLELVACGRPLGEILNRVVLAIEEQSSGMLCSILLASEDGRTLRHGAAPSLPEQYLREVDGAPVGEGVGSCGTAAFRREMVVVADIATDPLWVNFRGLARRHALGACWSTPIISTSGEVLGTFAMYYRLPRVPDAHALALLERAVDIAGIAIERSRSARRLQASESRLSAIIGSANEAIISVNRELRINLFNPAAEQMFQCPAREALGQPLQRFVPAGLREPGPAGATAASPAETSGLRGNGQRFALELSLSASLGGEEPLLILVLRDLTDRHAAEATRRSLEAQLRQAQKLEAVGQLAGGVAHDFNNILAAIQGNVDFIRPALPRGSPEADSLAAIQGGCRRAAQLVRQMLLFSRRQDQSLEVLPLGAIVQEGLQLIRASLPATVDLQVALAPWPLRIRADAGQLHQVVLNLVMNSAQALRGRPGRVEIAVEPVTLEGTPVERAHGLSAGAYARLRVSDNGPGMDEATLARVFEPFFTTKGPGEGSGLGLPVVHGIVQSHGGGIQLASRPGAGAVVSIYFPVVEALAGESKPAPPEASWPRGAGQHLLFVDDEPDLARIARLALERLGYRVTAFTDPVAALQRFREAPDDFELVITDLTMPTLPGLELVAALRATRPGLPVLLASGYAAACPPVDLRAHGIDELLSKPMTLETLAKAVHRALARGNGAAPGASVAI